MARGSSSVGRRGGHVQQILAAYMVVCHVCPCAKVPGTNLTFVTAGPRLRRHEGSSQAGIGPPPRGGEGGEAAGPMSLPGWWGQGERPQDQFKHRRGIPAQSTRPVPKPARR
jgi:hypothetical protein